MKKMNKEYSEFTQNYLDLFRERLSKFIEQKNTNEHSLSKDLGHSGSYINGITSGRSLPSFDEFLYICEILRVEPNEFFDIETKEPTLVKDLFEEVRGLNSENIRLLIEIAKSWHRK